MNELIELILHTDDALLALVSENVNKAYLILFLIILLETGLIFFPFLPGDGLLFSAGVIAATTELEVTVLIPLLIIAAIAGNLLNYFVGSTLGAALRASRNSIVQKFLKKYLPAAEHYYQKHGNQAVIIGRFFPIIRTYIPFVAGLAKMDQRLFFKNTLIGAFLWISLFLLTGFFLGEIPWVKNNYGLIFLSLIAISLIPFFWAIIRKMFFRQQR
ncbi:VTT domain-containing protein [uncultured Maribacter sp.]|uniref:VTT domain-containing protein n=1 Tax=uncultured Maribacter sp. TaxID=431308 RepID=UPI0030DD8749|tara:strand:+ start:310 stop:954 length:645 start_codon:yes stop_codon:yes gene_type:complete